MATLQEILARAQALREETALGSISPERAGSIMYDTLQQINQMQLEGGSLVISKIYDSVAAMQADTTPVSDLTGQDLRQGQLVVIVPSDTSSSDLGSVYRYNGTTEGASSWSFTGKIGGYPMDQTPTQGSTRAVTSGGVYEQITQLGQEVHEIEVSELESSFRNAGDGIVWFSLTSDLPIGKCKIELTAGPTSGREIFDISSIKVSPEESVASAVDVDFTDEGNNQAIFTNTISNIRYIRVKTSQSTDRCSSAKVYFLLEIPLKTIVSNVQESVSSSEKEIALIKNRSSTIEIPFSVTGKALQTSGNIANAESYDTTDFIPVVEGQRVAFTAFTSSGVWTSMVGYDSNKSMVSVLIEGFGCETQTIEVIIPSGVSYIRASGLSNRDARYTDRYLGIGITKILEKIEERIDATEEQINEINHEISKSEYLIKEGEIADNPNNGFAPWGGASVTYEDGYYSIDCSNRDGLYPGLRNNKLGFEMKERGAAIVVSIWAKSTDVDEAHPFYLYYAPETRTPRQFLTSEWQEFRYELTAEDVSVMDRIQLTQYAGSGVLDVKCLTVVLKDSLYNRVEVLSQSIVNPLTGKMVSIIGDSISSSARNNPPYWKIVASDVGQEISSYITWADIYADWNGTTPTNKTIGGVLLTESMVGTLQVFTPVSEDIGKVLGQGFPYNAAVKTWSELLCEKAGAEWLCDTAWSSARMTTGNGTDARQIAGSTGYSDCTIGRLRKRNDDGSWTNPDVVIIYMGTNDMTHSAYARIDDINIMNGIPQDDLIDGLHQFRAAYYRCIQKIRTAYPGAYVFCCTLNVFKRINYAQFPTNNGLYTLPQMNNAIREIADTMGCGLIEFDKDGITFENCYPTYISDSALTPTHPNETGHMVMAEKALADIKHYLNS